MGRKPDASIREELLRQSVDYCLQEGFWSLSLRALAEKIGTSHRMLIYHFQSSEGLFEAILEELRAGQLKKFEAAFDAVADISGFKTAIKGLWRQLASEQSRHYMLAYLEIQILEIRQGKSRSSSSYLNATLESWLSPIADTLLRLKFSKRDSRIMARAILSGGRGLILDWLGAGTASDQRQVQTTFDCLVDSLFDSQE